MKRMLALLPFAFFLTVLPMPGTVAARLLLLVACGSLALWQWWSVSGARAKLPCGPALLAWAAVCTASLVYTVDVTYTAAELKNEVGYTMVAFFAFFTVAADRDGATGLLRVLGAALALFGAWSTVDWGTHGFDWNEVGRYGGRGAFSSYLVTIVPVLAWLAIEDPLPYVRRIALGLLVFATFLAVIAAQRAVWPALGTQALVLLVHAYRRSLLSIGWRRVAVATIVVGFLVAIGIQWIHHMRYAGLGQIPLLTDDVRVSYWPNAVARIAEHPFGGTGFGIWTIHKAYPELTPTDVPALWHAHNVLLNYGLELGLPGMFALLILFAMFARFFWRAAEHEEGWASSAGLAILVGVLLRNQFNDFFSRDLSLLFWALIGLFSRLVVASAKSADDESRKQVNADIR